MQNANKIICFSHNNQNGSIYLGGLPAALEYSKLKELDVNAVLTVFNDKDTCQFQSNEYAKNNINHKVIDAADDEEQDLKQYFAQGINFIDDNIEKTNILVHCYGGVSRSATMLMAYLMQRNLESFTETLELVREKRKVYPNDSFVEQLLEFQNELGLN